MATTEPVVDDPPEVALWRFVRALRASRLLSPDDLALVEEQTTPDRLDGLQDLLVREGVLTAYQIERLRDGTPDGLVVGPYHVLDELGRGGGGQVFKARHAVMGRTVALKVINPVYCREPTAKALFRREVAATSRLAHPNVALTYDANEADGVLYLALELVGGPTLESHVADAGPLPVPLACSVAVQTAKALQHAYENGIVHRDVKPSNILLPGLARPAAGPADSALVKVVDFGLARLLTGDGARPTTILCPQGATLGTPAFMAPEQIRSVHDADTRSDLYSLGCTLYFALAGRLPFDGGNAEATFLMHLRAEAPPLRSWRPDVPAGLAAVVQRLMAKDPAARYQTPAELVEAVNEFVLSGGLAAPTPADAPRPALTPPPAVELEDTLVVLAQPAVPDAEAVPELHRLWGEWLAAVGDLLRVEGRAIPEAAYRRLYRRLLGAIRNSRGAPSGPTDLLLDRLHAHVEPWVNPDALARLDDLTRAAVLGTCRRLDSQISPAHRPAPAARLLVPVLMAALALVAYFTYWGLYR